MKIIDLLTTHLGTFTSVGGFAIAIWQIRKTRRAAEAARNAAVTTRNAIARNVLLSEVSASVNSIEELKTLIRLGRFEAALLRLSDVIAQLIQIQDSHQKNDQKIDLGHVLNQLSILRDLLERYIQNDQEQINRPKANRVLSRISDSLNRWVGRQKFLPNEEVQND